MLKWSPFDSLESFAFLFFFYPVIDQFILHRILSILFPLFSQMWVENFSVDKKTGIKIHMSMEFYDTFFAEKISWKVAGVTLQP